MTDYLDNSNKKIKLALQLVSGYGEFLAWRLPESYERAKGKGNTAWGKTSGVF